MPYFWSDYQVHIKKNFIETIKSAIQNSGPDRKNLRPDGLYSSDTGK